MYRPASLVLLVREVLVEVSLRVTVAPLTTAPLASVTTPVTVPVFEDCAQRGKALPRYSTAAAERNKVTTSDNLWLRTRMSKTLLVDRLQKLAGTSYIWNTPQLIEESYLAKLSRITELPPVGTKLTFSWASRLPTEER